MKKFSALVAIAAAASALLSSAPANAQAGYEKPLKIAITNTIEHPIGVGATKFAQAIEVKSGGKMKARVYPNASLGNDVQVISSLQGGTIDATVVAIGLLSSMVKDLSLFTLPAVFNNTKEVDQVLDGPFGIKLLDQLGAHRLVGLSYMEHGFKNIMNSKRPVAKWEDASGLKIRVTQTPSLVDVFKAIDTNPVPMAFGELYTALEQGAVDGMETTLVTFENGKFYEVQKYIGMTQHVYDPLALIFSKKVWDQMSPAQKKIVAEAAAEATAVQRASTRERESKLMDVMKSKGITVTTLSDQEMTRLRAKLEPVKTKYMKLVGEQTAREFSTAVEKARAAR